MCWWQICLNVRQICLNFYDLEFLNKTRNFREVISRERGLVFIELNKRRKHSALEFLILSGFYLDHFCQDFFRIVRIFFRKLILANPDNFVRIFVYGLLSNTIVWDFWGWTVWKLGDCVWRPVSIVHYFLIVRWYIFIFSIKIKNKKVLGKCE